MKLIHRLSLIVLVMLVTVPLVIMAQDQPTPPNNDDLFVPLPTADTGNDDDLFVPLPTADTSSDDLFIPIPTVEGGDLVVPLPEPDTCGNDDPNTDFIPICPPTNTPAPTRTPRPTAQPAPDVVNGLWVLDPKNDFSSTGTCKSPNSNDNGGPDHDFSGEEEQPTVPVCMTADKQWLSVASLGTYPLTVSPFYSQQQMRRELLETNGKTSGSMNVTYTRQYQVISPTEIEYSYIYQEAGGCTTKNTFHYKLKEVNDLVCTGAVMTPNFTAVPTQMPTPQPGETAQPVPTSVPPINEGRYIINLPLADAKCTTDKLPQSNAMDMTYDSNQNIFINFGGASYTLYWDGEKFYQYREGNRFGITLYIDSNGASFTWNKQGCRIYSQLMREGSPTPTPVPVEPTREANTDTTAIAGSTFTTTFDAQEAYCATENKALLPDLSTGVLTANAENNFVFSVGGQDYTLVNKNGYFIFSQVNADGSMLAISVNDFYEGVGSGSYTVIGAGNKICTALLTFTPAG
ncbi:MAG: hypothetical protein GC179_17655 [Anaerolineaceae bacterium]|nr:hypothetical protein [Anaerolineaceae bacterium]